MTSLKVDFCSYEAAKYAVEHWHYSKVMPAGKTVKVGVWEDEKYIGCVIFSRGANKHLASPYGLEQIGVCELARVALAEHESPVSQIVALAIRLLKTNSSNLRLIVSYADSQQGHVGSIYQAMNWFYVGAKIGSNQMLHGKVVHRRSVYSKCGRQDIEWLQNNVDPEARWVKMPPKYKYLYPLDKKMRRQILPLSQPYPKRASD